MKILLSHNKEVIKEYIPKNSKVGFIATAADLKDDKRYIEEDKKDLENMKFKLIDIDITKESKDEIKEKFSYIDAIFIAGGNCFYLLQQLKKKNVLKELIDFANKKIYIGSSAGACIACPSIDYVQKLDNKYQAPYLNNYNAMNLIDKYILPHYQSSKEYTELINETIKEHKDLDFLTIRNDQAIIVKDRKDYIIVNTN